MDFWIFRSRDTGQCLALSEEALQWQPISDDLGELLHEQPMSAAVARMYVTRYGGTIVEEPARPQTA